MIYSIRFLPEIEQDLVIGYKWYESKYTGLGEEFLRLFYAHASEISHNPLLFRKVYKDFSRRLMRRFPYVIYFRIDGSQITLKFTLSSNLWWQSKILDCFGYQGSWQ